MNGAGFATGSAAAICCISAGEESFGLGDGVFPYLQTQLGGKQGEELKGVHLRVMGLILGMMVCGDVHIFFRPVHPKLVNLESKIHFRSGYCTSSRAVDLGLILMDKST